MPARTLSRKRSLQAAYSDDEDSSSLDQRPTKRPRLQTNPTQIEADPESSSMSDNESDQEMDESPNLSNDSKHLLTVFHEPRVAPPTHMYYDSDENYRLKRRPSTLAETPDSTGVPKLSHMPSSQSSATFSDKDRELKEIHRTTTAATTASRTRRQSTSARTASETVKPTHRTTRQTQSARVSRPRTTETKTATPRSNRTSSRRTRRSPLRTPQKRPQLRRSPRLNRTLTMTKPATQSTTVVVPRVQPVIPRTQAIPPPLQPIRMPPRKTKPSRPPKITRQEEKSIVIYGVVLFIALFAVVSVYVNPNWCSFVASPTPEDCLPSRSQCLGEYGDLCALQTPHTRTDTILPGSNENSSDLGAPPSPEDDPLAGLVDYKRNIRGKTRQNEVVVEYERELKRLRDEIADLSQKNHDLKNANGDLLKHLNGGAQREGMCDAALIECKKRKQRSEKAVETLNQKLDTCRNQVRDFEQKWCY